VLGQFLASGPPCTLTSTSDATQAILFDRKRKACYLVGPTLLTGAAIDKATVVYDSTSSQWAVNLHWGNDDFLTKVANPLVNREVAIVVNDVVQSAPTINPGFTGRAVEITGDFSRADAVKAAAAIAGVAGLTIAFRRHLAPNCADLAWMNTTVRP
jgi:preprotein translocase subunit SecD